MTIRTMGWGAIATLFVLACGLLDDAAEQTAGGSGSDHGGSSAEGSHGKRVLKSGAFELELGIFERGVPPEFRAWATQSGRAVDAQDFSVDVKLARLGGKVDVVAFAPRGDYRVSTRAIAEPHSFDVTVSAVHEGQSHSWTFESFEGRTQIDSAMAESLGVETKAARAATLAESVIVYGKVRTNPERTREIRARFDGVIRAVYAELGSSVGKGEKILSIESDESLKRYTIAAPISGTVTQRVANPGEQTNERLLMTITDTSSVWVDLSVFPVDREGVVVGREVSITPALGGESISGVISMIETTADPHDQSVVARVALEGAGVQFLPGTFVEAAIKVREYEAPLAVRRTALQTWRGFQVVYAQVGDAYEVRTLELGREAGPWIEVLGGLEPGTRYVTANSHLIKADIEKSGAAHDH